jgi:S1-C subfamily serine protease
MRKVVCAWMLLIACRSNGADLAQPDMDGVRGLSNHALCDQLQPGSKSSDALLCEIKARGLICSSLDEEGWDYTPDAHATAPSASGTAETTSGTGLNQASAESTSAPMVETPAPKSTPVEESVIRLSSGNTVGSGFYIDATHIVTNAHVVGRASQVTLARSNGSPFVGRVLFQNTDVDFAIIETDIQGSPVTVRRTPQTEGEGVRKITPCCIIHDALIAAGSSGGPLVDRNREVIGLNTLISKMPGDDTNSSDRGITVKLQYISQMLLGNSKEIHR